MAAKISDYLRPDVIRRVKRLDLKARFVVEGFIAGLHRSPFQGPSVEFSDHRKYEPGDELRHIDWNVFCRTDKLYTRKYRAETNMTAYLVVDRSASMDVRYGDATNKAEYAQCLAAALAYLMIRQRDAVGIITFDSRIQSMIPPSSKRQQLVNVLAELAKPGRRTLTDFPEVFGAIARLIKRRSVIMVFSDLLGQDEDEIERALKLLRVRMHDVIVFHILDEAEVNLLFDDAMLFEDVESDDEIEADPVAIRDAYRKEVTNFIDRVRRSCLEARIEYTQLDTSIPFDQGLLRFLEKRRKLAR